MAEPMTDERLAKIRRYLARKADEMRVIDLSRLSRLSRGRHLTNEDVARERLHYFASELLAEVERLRAADLSKSVILMVIADGDVVSLTGHDGNTYCKVCSANLSAHELHDSACIVTEAREMLGYEARETPKR